VTSEDLEKTLADYSAICALSARDKTKCLLIHRYRYQVSRRLIIEYDSLIKKGKAIFQKKLVDALKRPSIFDVLGVNRKGW